MSSDTQNSKHEHISEFVQDGHSIKKVVVQAKAAGALKKIGDEFFIDREKLLNTEEKKYRRLSESEKLEFHYQKYQNIETLGKIDQIISKIEAGLERRYEKIDELSNRKAAEKNELKRTDLDKERARVYNDVENSELKLEAAEKRREEIEAKQKSIMESVNKRRQKRANSAVNKPKSVNQ